MARVFPQDVRLQKYIEEQYDHQARAFVKAHLNLKCGHTPMERAEEALELRLPVPSGITNVIPNRVAVELRKQERERERLIREEVRCTHPDPEHLLHRVPPVIRDSLYEEVSQNMAGRYQYLKARECLMPERRYTVPLTATMIYGWKLKDNPDMWRRPKFALKPMSYFTRRYVTDLSKPAEGEPWNIDQQHNGSIEKYFSKQVL